MANYDYADDGRYHTRYSEVIACQTPKQAIAVAKKRLGLVDRYESDIMRFGTMRHEMWDAEVQESGKSPAIFKDQLGVEWGVYESEKHRATELFDGVVIHFTTDLIGLDSEATVGDEGAKGVSIIDYKTATEHRVSHYRQYYTNQLQLPSYAMLLRPHGIIAKDAHYLIECWDRERKNLKGYIHVPKKIELADMARAKQMFKKGVQNLIDAEAYVRKHYM